MIDITPFTHMLFAFSVSTVRIITIFAIVPFLSKQLIQGLIRNSIIMAIALVLYPMIAPTVPPDMPSLPLLTVILAKEVIIGLVIGFLVGIIFWVAEGVGAFIDNQRGTTIASTLNPMSGAQTSLLGSMFLQMFIVLFFTGGGFLFLLSSLFESYRIWPVFSFIPSFDKDFALFFLQQTDKFMKLTILFSSPIIIAVFISELGLGLINRFAPQLNVFFLSLPINSGIACLLLILYVPLLAHFLEEHLKGSRVLIMFLRNLIGG
jgi:type III secretion protein T